MSEFKVGDLVHGEVGGFFSEGVVIEVGDTENAMWPYFVEWSDGLTSLRSADELTLAPTVKVGGEGELDLVEETSGLTKVGKTFQGYKENGDLHYPSPEEEEEYTGGSSSYYDVTVNGTEIRCLDIIEALNMNYAEGNAFKAVWRIAASKQGKQKKGNTRLYDAEKVVFFGERLVEEHSG